MARVPLVPDDEAAPKAREVFDATRAASGSIPDLYRALANSPDVLRAWTRLAWPLRALETTPRAVRELVILRIAQLTGSDYEWHHHVPMATQAGISAEQIERLADWRRSDLFSAEERAVLGYAESVIGTGEIDEAAFSDLSKVMPTTSVVDLTVTAAWYLAVSRVIAALGPFSEHGELQRGSQRAGGA